MEIGSHFQIAYRIDCDFGVSLTFGKTYYLHKKPLLNMIKYGIDATWFELSYAKYSEPDVFAEGGSYTRALMIIAVVMKTITRKILIWVFIR